MTLEAALRSAWVESVGSFRANLVAIRDAAEFPDDADRLTAARGAAHRLAGSLGMFGLDRGSALANELETLLKVPAGPDRSVILWRTDVIGAEIDAHDSGLIGTPAHPGGGGLLRWPVSRATITPDPSPTREGEGGR